MRRSGPLGVAEPLAITAAVRIATRTQLLTAAVAFVEKYNSPA
jgi:hypothetical protein